MLRNRSFIGSALCGFGIHAVFMITPQVAGAQCSKGTPVAEDHVGQPSSPDQQDRAAKSTPCCGRHAAPVQAPPTISARKLPARTDVDEADLRSYFDGLGLDAGLWYQHVQTLANPAFEGRAPGTRGSELAAEYIEFYFRQYGLRSLFPRYGERGMAKVGGSYRQPVSIDDVLPAGYEKSGSLAINGDRLVAGEDFVITANARSATATGAVSFVGYGLELGEDGYSSFDKGTDLHNRVALLLRLEPLTADGRFLWGSQPSRHSSLASKLKAVANRGAAGILIVTPPGAQATLPVLDPLPAIAGGCAVLPSLPTAMITPAAVNHLLKVADPQSRDLMTLRRLADEGRIGTVHLSDDVEVTLESRIVPPQVTGENIAGLLPGRGNLKDEWLVIGGHYDALGHPPQGTACYSGGAFLPGADDNASGTAAVLILAQRLSAAYAAARQPLDLRSIVFVAFAAEERGLLGSRHFVQHAPLPLGKLHAMLNLDMIGRLRQNTLYLSGIGTAAEFSDLLGADLERSGLQVFTQPGGTGSDQVSFWNAGIPALFLMTGVHEELHTPADRATTVNPQGAVRVIDLAEKMAMRLATDPDPLSFVAQSSALASGCAGLRPATAGAALAPSANNPAR